jgi:pyruvate dehydrogenase E1 component alpha subunit
MPIPQERKLAVYETMVRIRHFEEKSIELYGTGQMPGRVHPYIGEEAVAVGACAAMEERDVLTSTHRGTGHLIARAADLRRMFAEFLGKETGYNRGKGGPMHFGIPELGVLCTNGIVGSGITVAAGAALAAQLQGTGQVAISFFGDGASNTGSFHEGLNLAAIWKVPAIFLCENNCYGETMPVSRAIAIEDIASRAAGYGMPGVVVDGNDVEAVHDATRAAAERARRGDGATLIEAKTYRIGWHFHGESTHYRRREEIDAWKERDPIDRYGARLVDDGICGKSDLEAIDARIGQEVGRAMQQALDDPHPRLGSLLDHVRLPLAWEVGS